jgi:Raf kinase inhibitor-like YbhB/YbcL family protein
VQCTNDFGKLGYNGPCPPSGTHRYRFTAYALDAVLPLDAAAPVQRVREALEGHILDTGRLTGLYARSRRDA